MGMEPQTRLIKENDGGGWWVGPWSEDGWWSGDRLDGGTIEGEREYEYGTVKEVQNMEWVTQGSYEQACLRSYHNFL